MDLTYSAYFAFLGRAQQRGYVLSDFRRPPALSGLLLLRHDIDLNLAAAVHLAEMEQKAGVISTYFVRMTAPYYNVKSASGRASLRRIVEAGHCIGLHFDPTLYGENGSVRAAWCAREAIQLETALNRQVEVVSFHKPGVLVGTGSEITGARVNAYAPCFVRDIDYCSDSSGAWRFGPPDERESYAEGRSLHLLVHPENLSSSPQSAEVRNAATLDAMAEAVRREAEAELWTP